MRQNLISLFAATVMVCAAETSAAQNYEGVPINGVIWAKTNVGVKGKFMDNPWDYGLVYTFEEAQTACPKGWRTPTKQEFDVLLQAAVKEVGLNDEHGYQFGNGENTIFLVIPPDPHYPPQEETEGMAGYYWSSTIYDTDNAGMFSIGWYTGITEYDKKNVASVRCVKE